MTANADFSTDAQSNGVIKHESGYWLKKDNVFRTTRIYLSKDDSDRGAAGHMMVLHDTNEIQMNYYMADGRSSECLKAIAGIMVFAAEFSEEIAFKAAIDTLKENMLRSGGIRDTDETRRAIKLIVETHRAVQVGGES